MAPQTVVFGRRAGVGLGSSVERKNCLTMFVKAVEFGQVLFSIPWTLRCWPVIPSWPALQDMMKFRNQAGTLALR